MDCIKQAIERRASQDAGRSDRSGAGRLGSSPPRRLDVGPDRSGRPRLLRRARRGPPARATIPGNDDHDFNVDDDSARVLVHNCPTDPGADDEGAPHGSSSWAERQAEKKAAEDEITGSAGDVGSSLGQTLDDYLGTPPSEWVTRWSSEAVEVRRAGDG